MAADALFFRNFPQNLLATQLNAVIFFLNIRQAASLVTASTEQHHY